VTLKPPLPGTPAANTAGTAWTVSAGASAAQVLAVFTALTADDRVVFEGGSYSITSPLTVSVPGVTVDASLATITQLTVMKPVFDILSGGSRTRIVARQLVNESGQRYPGLGGDVTFRGERLSHYSAGVYLGADRCEVDINTVDGFYTGVSAYPLASGDIALEAEGTRKKGNKVRIGRTVNIDMGILFCGQDGLDFDMSGTFDASATSIHPPHLVYATNNRSSKAVTGRGNAYDGTPCDAGLGQDNVAHAFQFKGVLSGVIERLHARNCYGVLSLAEDTSLAFGVVNSEETLEAPAGAVYFQGLGENNCHIGLARIQWASGKSDNRAARLDGTDNMIETLIVEADLATGSSDAWATVQGTRNQIGAMDVRNAGDGGRRAAQVVSGDGHMVRLRRARNVSSGIGLTAGTTLRLHTDPNAVSYGSATAADRRAVFDSGATTPAITREPRAVSIVGASSALPRQDASGCTHILASINDNTNMTVLNPNGASAGMGISYEIFNNTGGALGTLTWDTAFTLKTAWAQPATTVHTTIKFTHNGTSWREVSRV
jgi:hypothetical protein